VSGASLRRWERDAGLPARAGDAQLSPLPPDEVLRLVHQHMLRAAPEDRPVQASWTYARWKPGVSLCSAYELTAADGRQETLVVKCHVGAKAAGLAEREPERASAADTEWPMLLGPPVALPERNLYLWGARDDRELPALRRLSDSERNRQLMRHVGTLLPEGTEIRKRRSTSTLLRYRPERRAVVRLDLALRLPDGGKSKLSLAARALPTVRAEEVDRIRQAAGTFGPAPRYHGMAERDGLLLEEWLDVSVPSGQEFGHADRAGRLLAQLHAQPLAAGLPQRAAPDLEGLRAWFDWSPELRRESEGLLVAAPPPEQPCWTHGDFHPDQVATDRRDGSSRLLDLDEIFPGDPFVDLASWVADHLVVADVGLEEASSALFAGYRAAGGRLPPRATLAPWIAVELVQRAAACCRRLELGGEATAVRLLRRARALRTAPGGGA